MPATRAIAVEAAVVAAEEALTIGAVHETDDLARRALALIDDTALDVPEVRCRALLLIGECLTWNPVGDFASARALLSEAGWLAVEHGWPRLAARAATHLLAARAARRRTIPRGTELLEAVLGMGVEDDSRPARAAIAASSWVRMAIAPIMNEAIAAIEALAADVETYDPFSRVLVAGNRWWLHFGDPDADDRTLASEARVAFEATLGFRVIEVLASSLRHGDRDDFDTIVAELRLFVARGGAGHAHVSMIETTVALLDGRLADAERLAFDTLANVHPESNYATVSAVQVAAVWTWSGRDEDLLNALDGFATDRRSQRALVELSAISARAATGGTRPPLRPVRGG